MKNREGQGVQKSQDKEGRVRREGVQTRSACGLDNGRGLLGWAYKVLSAKVLRKVG